MGPESLQGKCQGTQVPSYSPGLGCRDGSSSGARTAAPGSTLLCCQLTRYLILPLTSFSLDPVLLICKMGHWCLTWWEHLGLNPREQRKLASRRGPGGAGWADLRAKAAGSTMSASTGGAGGSRVGPRAPCSGTTPPAPVALGPCLSRPGVAVGQCRLGTARSCPRGTADQGGRDVSSPPDCREPQGDFEGGLQAGTRLLSPCPLLPPRSRVTREPLTLGVLGCPRREGGGRSLEQ